MGLESAAGADLVIAWRGSFAQVLIAALRKIAFVRPVDLCKRLDRVTQIVMEAL